MQSVCERPIELSITNLNFVIGQNKGELLENFVSSRVASYVLPPSAKLFTNSKFGIYSASYVTLHTTMVIMLDSIVLPAFTPTINFTLN